MPARDIIAIGASGGGVDAIRAVVRSFPADFPAAIFVVLHVAPTTPSVLPQILARAGPLPASHARDGEAIAHGRIYVAPPDRHLVVTTSGIALSEGPRENRQRPAVDVLFRSAAASFGPRVIGVVLTGSLDDGTAGLYAIKTHGGVSIVQDPADAAFPGMPRSALEIVEPTYVLDLTSIGAKIAEVVKRSSHEPRAPGAEDPGRANAANGLPSQLSCPECNGPLVELHDANLTRYRCHTGHSFAPESLFEDQSEHFERSQWNALRALDESAQVARRLEARAVAAQRAALALRYRERATEAQQRVERIKEILKRRARAD